MLDFKNDFERLLGSYEHIKEIKSPLQRRYILNRIAAFHGLPKAECRKMFQLFCAEMATHQGGQS